MDIEWADPGESSTVGKWDAIRAELQRNPGRWARLRTYASLSVSSSTGTRWKREGFEATSRCEGDVYALYVRWPQQSS